MSTSRSAGCCCRWWKGRASAVAVVAWLWHQPSHLAGYLQTPQGKSDAAEQWIHAGGANDVGADTKKKDRIAAWRDERTKSFAGICAAEKVRPEPTAPKAEGNDDEMAEKKASTEVEV